MMRDLKVPLAILAALIALLVGVYLLSYFGGGTGSRGSENVVVDMFTPAPPSPEVLKMLEKSRGFEVLISYTDRGFEPLEALIGAGESVRFTNNSSGNLWVAANGTAENPAHPGTSECGGSALDTCAVLAPREFWEFTFETPGVWTFKNNLDKGKTGAVRVEVQ